MCGTNVIKLCSYFLYRILIELISLLSILLEKNETKLNGNFTTRQINRNKLDSKNRIHFIFVNERIFHEI
jgi:hypothetical protein